LLRYKCLKHFGQLYGLVEPFPASCRDKTHGEDMAFNPFLQMFVFRNSNDCEEVKVNLLHVVRAQLYQHEHSRSPDRTFNEILPNNPQGTPAA